METNPTEILIDAASAAIEEPSSRVVVRLARSYWFDPDGAYSRTTLRYLKRQTTGWNFLDDDCHDIGADDALTRIVNLHQSKDGLYELVMCNFSTDWETGYAEDWDYKLVPLKEAK